MALITAQDHILMALRKIGQQRPGATPSPEILAEILNDWQVFFDELNAERNNVWSNPDYVYPVLGPGSQNFGNGYTIGPSGADWTGPRPNIIIRANLVFQSGGQPKVYIGLTPLTQEEWADLSVRQIPATSVTTVFWYDPQWPNGVFNVFPPLSGNSIEIFETGILAAPASLNSSYNAPPGYADMVIWNLAKRNYFSMTMFLNKEKMPYGVVCGYAKRALDKVRILNTSFGIMDTDSPSGGGPDRYGLFDRDVTYTGTPY